ncbi:MAG: hypothetical protein Q8L48_11930 [Archangium sp.]|nr:hypothetical protein [Archangium sp.]
MQTVLVLLIAAGSTQFEVKAPNAAELARRAPTVGGKCAPDGLACAGCWGSTPWTCERGRWELHHIPPPP